MPLKSRKPTPDHSQGLIEFIRNELDNKGISLRAAASGIGISHSHLSDLMAGKKTPDAGVCNAIAMYFDKPQIEIYRLAGWLNVQDDPDDLDSLKKIAENEAQFLEWKRVYESIGDSEERKRFVRILIALDQRKKITQ